MADLILLSKAFSDRCSRQRLASVPPKLASGEHISCATQGRRADMSAADERMSAVGPGGELSPLLAVGAQAPVVRLLVLSDLHLEFGSFVPPPRE
jgi:hypothetical protein